MKNVTIAIQIALLISKRMIYPEVSEDKRKHSTVFWDKIDE